MVKVGGIQSLRPFERVRRAGRFRQADPTSDASFYPIGAERRTEGLFEFAKACGPRLDHHRGHLSFGDRGQGVDELAEGTEFAAVVGCTPRFAGNLFEEGPPYADVTRG